MSIAVVRDHTFTIFLTPTYARYTLQYMEKNRETVNAANRNTLRYTCRGYKTDFLLSTSSVVDP